MSDTTESERPNAGAIRDGWAVRAVAPGIPAAVSYEDFRKAMSRFFAAVGVDASRIAKVTASFRDRTVEITQAVTHNGQIAYVTHTIEVK